MDFQHTHTGIFSQLPSASIPLGLLVTHFPFKLGLLASFFPPGTIWHFSISLHPNCLKSYSLLMTHFQLSLLNRTKAFAMSLFWSWATKLLSYSCQGLWLGRIQAPGRVPAAEGMQSGTLAERVSPQVCPKGGCLIGRWFEMKSVLLALLRCITKWCFCRTERNYQSSCSRENQRERAWARKGIPLEHFLEEAALEQKNQSPGNKSNKPSEPSC